jgi:hypothetical protein
MPHDEKLLKRRERIKRIAMAGAVPAVIAVIAGSTAGELGAAPPPPPPPPPSAVPEPGMMLLTGLGLAGVVGAVLRKKKKGPADSDSE